MLKFNQRIEKKPQKIISANNECCDQEAPTTAGKHIKNKQIS